MTSSDLFVPAGDGQGLIGASTWLLDLAQGDVPRILPVLAVAFLGYQVMLGQRPIRKALITILGCFVLVGSAVIALGLVEAVEGEAEAPRRVENVRPPPLSIPSPAQGVRVNPFDPYAGRNIDN